MPDPVSLLSQILCSRLTVTVESDNNLINKVESKIKRRATELAAKGKTLEIKLPQVAQKLGGKRPWSIRPIDLLRKLGDMTTPPFLPLEKMPQLSASWATRRYFWAIQPPVVGTTGPFQLSEEARELDFHQKTLLSDEFGVGMAGLLMETHFAAPECLDMSYALRSPDKFQNVSLDSEVSPDYLMWGAGTTYYVVECKGCQTTQSVAVDQIRRGLEQVVPVEFGSGPFNSATLVVSTFLGKKNTRLFVIDPPEDENSGRGEYEARRAVRIEDHETFRRQASLGNQTRILVWAGLYESASAIYEELHVRGGPFRGYERRRMTRDTPKGMYEGTISPLFPELGRAGLAVFTGVRHDLLTLTPSPTEGEKPPAHTNAGQRDQESDVPSNVSYGENGTCMIIDGL